MSGAAMPSALARYRPLWLIVALLALPFAIAAGLYLWGWHPDHAGNHGELLAPPRVLPTLTDSTGRPTQLDGHWTLVVAGSGPCDDACRRWVVSARQVHVALYKQMPRVRRAWLTDLPAPDPAPLVALQPDLVTLRAPDPGARAAFDLGEPGHRVFVVDPAGRVILRYAPDADPRGILKDLERLLRYAWAG